jgi:CBS domain containing-hemolysin-like protein
MIRRGDAKAKLARRAILALDRSISGTQLGITLASLGLGWVGEPAIAHTIEGLFAPLGPLAPIATS